MSFWNSERFRKYTDFPQTLAEPKSPCEACSNLDVFDIGSDNGGRYIFEPRGSGGFPRGFAALGGLFTFSSNFLDLGFGEMLDADEMVVAARDTDQLIQFGLECHAIPVLSVLDQEDH